MKTNQILAKSRFYLVAADLRLGAAALMVLSSASSSSAQSGSESIGTFSFLGQNNTEVMYENTANVRPFACVPTAVANGLYYLEHNAAMEGQPDPFTVSPGNYTAVNVLAQAMNTTSTYYYNPNPPHQLLPTGGTTIAGAGLGLINYLSPGGKNPAPRVSVTGQYSPDTPGSWIGPGSGVEAFTENFAKTTPTAAYLAEALNENDGVEIGIQFGNFGGNSALTFNPTGGHEVTLYDIDFNAATERGSIEFIDPFGTSAYTVDGTLTLTDGFLYVKYQTQKGQTVFGRILDDMVESVNAPDGGMTSCLLGGGLAGLGALRRWRWKSD
jgi:hypothetical protein